MNRVSVLISLLLMTFFSLASATLVQAVEAIDVKTNVKVLDLDQVVEFHKGDGDRLQVSTAPGPDGIVQRIEVRARSQTTPPGWVVFALSNNSDSQIDRYLVVPHFRMSGSGLLTPDLGSQRVASISTSQGFAPERISDAEADVFQVTLDPGNVVTFVVEQSHKTLPGLSLWQPAAYKDYVNSYTFYRGIVLGISGLLALFLIILFVVKGAAMFPAAALLAWSVLAYLAIDFGFMGRLFDISTASEPIWRAVAEVVFSASILVLLFTYLTLHRWHVRYLHVTGIWLIFLIVVLGIALFDPPLGAGIARLSMAVTSVAGFAVILYLAYTGFDRAIMLIPTWILLLLWLAASGAAVVGVLDNDLVQPALSGGLVLLVLLFCFTIMQHAFSGGILAQGIVSDSERRALAVVGAGDMVWDWDVPRDRIYTSGEAERLLGLKHGAMDGHARDWLDFLHPQDRDRFSAMLDAVIDQRRGKVNQDFRLRAEDGHYRWFKLRVRPVVGTDGEVVRCVGTLLDITHQRTTEERMLHDAVHDNLTGLANRELLQDRLGTSMTRAQVEGTAKPSVLLIDIDDFRDINDTYGLSIGDSILLTVARRLTRLLKPQDSIARFYGDQFAVILLSEQQPERIAVFADSVRKVLKVPVVFGDKELTLSVSTGIAIHDAQVHQTANDVIADAELALFHAKRMGGDRIEPFRPSLRQQGRGRGPLDKDLVEALERKEIDVVFQPIVGLDDRQIKGFEALARWRHPQRGNVPPADFIPAAERTGLIVPIGIFVLEQAARQLSVWQRQFEDAKDLFMSVNVSSEQLLRHDLIGDVKTVLSRSSVNPGTLKLELTESLVMENPEYANQVLDKLRAMGAGLSLDDFGTGYSSLSYLQHFPFDTLKIDKSFVGHENGAAPIILQSIVQLSKDLHLNLVAEGVESEEAAKQLLTMGCPLAQGYLFGKPVAHEDASQMLKTQIELARQRAAEHQAIQREEERRAAEEKARKEQHRREEEKRKEAEKLEQAQARARQIAEKPVQEPVVAPKATPATQDPKSAPEELEDAAASLDLEEQLAAGLAASIAADALDLGEGKEKAAKPQPAASVKASGNVADNAASDKAQNTEANTDGKTEAKGTEANLEDMDLALESAIGAAAAEAVADLNAEETSKDKPAPRSKIAKPRMDKGVGEEAKAPVKEEKKPKGGFFASKLRDKVEAASSAVRNAVKGKDDDDGVKTPTEAPKTEARPDKAHAAKAMPAVKPVERKGRADERSGGNRQASKPQAPLAPPVAEMKPPVLGQRAPMKPAQLNPNPVPTASAPTASRPPQAQPNLPSDAKPDRGNPPSGMPTRQTTPPPAAPSAGQSGPAAADKATPVSPTPSQHPATDQSGRPAGPDVQQAGPGAKSPAHAQPAPAQPSPMVKPEAPAEPVAKGPVLPGMPGHPAQTSEPVIEPQAPVEENAVQDKANGVDPAPNRARPGKEEEGLPFAMPDMSGIDSDIAAAIQSAMRTGKKD